MANTRSHRRPPVESFTATVSLGGPEFAFRLLSRPLPLGPGVEVRYFWMDSTQFRISRARRGSADPNNLRQCVGYWWRASQLAGCAGEPAQLQRLLLAASFALVGANKGPQRVYRDAYLAPGATDPEGQSLADESRARIARLVASRDALRCGLELDRVLGACSAPAHQEDMVLQTIGGILDRGVELVRAHGELGLEEFLATFDAWSAAKRRRGGQAFLPWVLDLFSFLAKRSFFVAYSSAWSGLIPWLQEHLGLDPISARYLRVWHTQRRPDEKPDGNGSPDPFGGQVLSLHPLSAYFMKDPALCAVAGRLVGSAAYDSAFGLAEVDTGDEYWDLVGAVLTAAHLYSQALNDQQRRRGVYERRLASDPAAAPDARLSVKLTLEEFAAARGVCCPLCSQRVELRNHGPDPESEDVSIAVFSCLDCGQTVTVPITREDLLSSL